MRSARSAAGLFAVRGVVFWVYWGDPARHEQAIEPWMTPGYIAHSWRVPRAVVVEALHAPVPPPKGPGGAERPLHAYLSYEARCQLF